MYTQEIFGSVFLAVLYQYLILGVIQFQIFYTIPEHHCARKNFQNTQKQYSRHDQICCWNQKLFQT